MHKHANCRCIHTAFVTTFTHEPQTVSEHIGRHSCITGPACATETRGGVLRRRGGGRWRQPAADPAAGWMLHWRRCGREWPAEIVHGERRAGGVARTPDFLGVGKQLRTRKVPVPLQHHLRHHHLQLHGLQLRLERLLPLLVECLSRLPRLARSLPVTRQQLELDQHVRELCPLPSVLLDIRLVGSPACARGLYQRGCPVG